jgi:two-component system LytT family response regulator
LLLQSFSIQKPHTTIKISTPTGFHLVDIENIIRCEAKGSYTNIFLTNGKNYMSSKSLKEYEDLLPANMFFRSHHSHLINMNFIIKYNRGKGGEIEMKDKSIVPLASRRKNDFLQLFELKE